MALPVTVDKRFQTQAGSVVSRPIVDEIRQGGGSARVNASGLLEVSGQPFDLSSPDVGDTPQWDGTKWVAAAASSGTPTAISGAAGTVNADAVTGIAATATAGADNGAGDGHPGLGFSFTAGAGGNATAGDDDGGAGGDIILIPGAAGTGHGMGSAGQGGRFFAYGDNVNLVPSSFFDLNVIGANGVEFFGNSSGVFWLHGGPGAAYGIDMSQAGKLTLAVAAAQGLTLTGLPTSDPGVANRVFSQNGIVSFSGFAPQALQASGETTDNIVAALVALGLATSS